MKHLTLLAFLLLPAAGFGATIDLRPDGDDAGQARTINDNFRRLESQINSVSASIVTASTTTLNISSITADEITSSTITATTAFIASGSIGTSTPAVNGIYADTTPKVIGVIDGTTPALIYAVNITSIARPSTGLYDVSFQRDFASTAYACTATMLNDNGFIRVSTSPSLTTAHTVRVATTNSGTTLANRDFALTCFGAQ